MPDLNASLQTHYLPPTSRLGEFEVIRRLGEGGFSIVYLAWDHSLERQVAVKEYMPSAVSTRSHTNMVSVRSEHHRETFDVGLKSFINESKLLAQFDHPALVKVYRFWEANGTAYMAMPFYKGLTFKDTVQSSPAPPDETWLMDLLAPLTAALGVIHARSCYHRDIAPDNIIILAENSRPLLLDFGAARQVIGDMTQSLTVILKPGYAPIEQYAEVPGLMQGPWTDVYALAATIYWAISGKPPPASVGRIVRDSCLPLADVARGRYSALFLQAIDRALKVLPEDRTPSIEAFRRDLGIEPPLQLSTVTNRWEDPDATVIRQPAKAPSQTTPHRQGDDSPVTPASPATHAPHSPAALTLHTRGRWIAGGLVLLVVAGIAAFTLTRDRQESPMPVPVAVPQPQNQPPAPAPAPMPVALPRANTDPVPSAAAPVSSSPASSLQDSPLPSPTPAAQSLLTPATPTRRDAQPPPSSTAKKPPPETPAKTAKTEPKSKPPTSDSAECARLMTQLSLGDDSGGASAKLRTLNCR